MGGDYSNNKIKGIYNTALGNRTIDRISRGGGQNCKDGDTSENNITTSGYRTTNCYTS